MTDENLDSDSPERRSVLKALGAGGLAAMGVGASAGSATAAKSETASLTGDLTDVALTDGTGSTVGTITDGTLSIDDLQIDQKTGELLASGTIDGVTSSGDQISQSFQKTTATITDTEGDCTILSLDLGPLDLELLGLNVFLKEVVLDITGSTGAGNLLGNLLCAVANLGSSGLSNLANSIVSALNNLLNQLLG
jgi:hypothetical protein